MIALWWAASALAGAVGEGSAAFDAGRLDDAVAAWSQPAASGSQPSGIVDYDLGIAWYRKGDLPRAIARFRGAARTRPRDGWVHHNLALARAGLTNLPDPIRAVGWQQVLTPGELGVLSVLLTAFGSAAMAIRHLRGGKSQVSWAGPTLVWALGLGLGGLAVAAARDAALHPVAVVVDGEGSLRDAASVDGAVRLTLPAGTEVRVEQAYDAFFLVSDSRGRRGWIARNAVDLAWTGRYTEQSPRADDAAAP